MSGHKESVQMLCIFPETDRNIFDRKGNTPLHQAIMHWQDGLLEMLIQDGADKDRPHAITGLPPLHFAASMQSLKKVQELLKAQADPTKRIEGPQCSWCKDHNSPPGRNARCVLQEVPDQDRTPEYCSINRLLSDAILRPNGAGSGSTNSSRRGKIRSPYRVGSLVYVL
ncbi:hypothetical protein BDV23DRAFT_155302 [Aspergillus alliaceus]|uniref:Uncharacterized protein n=1 Tax=Petromyces alliaceus TaxID=209559 RepID=A0A5N7C8A2_PETAA|nr:hypothetical protein BDV23DRAFT_155302 [Aspergillus alliaceus]